jgi:flagellar hook-basal body complex protein FliE
MNITNIQSLNAINPIEKKTQTTASNGVGFEEMLNKYINNADSAVKGSENMALSLAKGDDINLHDVTIAAQKASIAVTLTTTVRDRAVEAYQEIMRMQL